MNAQTDTQTDIPIPASRRSPYTLIVTIADLIALIEQPPDPMPRKLKQLREEAAPHLEDLKLFDPARSARHWGAGLRTVKLFKAVPEIKLVIGCGTPLHRSRVTLTPALREMAARQGKHLHRWGSKAFTLARPPFPKP